MEPNAYDPYKHIRDLQALFRAENAHAIKLAEAGEKLACEHQRVLAAMIEIESTCDRPSKSMQTTVEPQKFEVCSCSALLRYPAHLPRGVCIIPFRASEDGGSIEVAVSQRLSVRAPGQHQFPGGRVEAGEGFFDAATREFLEETGMTSDLVNWVLLGYAYPLTGYNGEPYVGARFGVRMYRDQELKAMEPTKATPWQWVGLDQLDQLNMLSDVKGYAKDLAYVRFLL